MTWEFLSLLCFVIVRGNRGEKTGYYGLYESPMSLFEMQGATQVNTFTRLGFYRAILSEFSLVTSYVKSPVKMGMYVSVKNKRFSTFEYAIASSLDSSLPLGSRGGVNCSGDDLFEVQGKLYGNFFEMKIINKQPLDEKRCESYILIVEAKLDERTVDKTKVFIHTPLPANFDARFNVTRMSAVIPSDLPLFQPIIQLRSRDLSDVGKVHFSLKNKSPYFLLNPANGVLMLKLPLPVDNNQFHLVALMNKMSEKTNEQTSKEERCKITIKVRRVNEHSPTIHIQTVHSLQVSGNMILLGEIVVNDRDHGKNGKIDYCKITSGNETGKFYLKRISPNAGHFKLYVTNSVDCLNCPSHVTFQAADKGDHPKTAVKKHSFVLDQAFGRNDCSLIRNQVVDVTEMLPVGYSIIDLQSIGSNANISCSAVVGDKFALENCRIILASPLNALIASSYVMLISYKISCGSIVRAGLTTVHVNVIDFNNHMPVFLTKTNYIEIPEGMAVNSEIYKVHAQDGDVGENGRLIYWFTKDSNQFAINSTTGVISIKKVLDLDLGEPWLVYLVVRAADNGLPFRREAEIVITVKIKARNDNLPVIKQDSCHIKLPVHASVGMAVLRLQAVDIDLYTGSKISFSLVSGNDQGFFSIDADTGYLTLSKQLPSDHRMLTLQVSASDGSRKSRNNAILKIKVESDLNTMNASCVISDAYLRALKLKPKKAPLPAVKPLTSSRTYTNVYAPEFASKTLYVTVSTNVNVGAVLVVLKADDKDVGYEGLLTYYMVEVNRYFSLDPMTGELKVVEKPDWRFFDKYELNVSAWDSGKPRKVAFQNIVVRLNDAVGRPPKFTKEFYNVSVNENSPGGSVIVNLIRKENMGGRRFTHKLVNDYDKLFSLGVRNGGLNLVANKRLDYEFQQVFELHVLALGPFSENISVAHCIVLVNVKDINDNRPTVYNKDQKIVIMRDLPSGSAITQVAADDLDSGDNGRLKFSLTNTSFYSRLFSIDANSGLIKLHRSLHVVSQDSFDLSVLMSDCGMPSLNVSAYLDIVVMSKANMQNLRLSSSRSGIEMYSVHENLQAGEQILELRDSRYIFSIVDGTDPSKFKLVSGFIVTTEPLDREIVAYYWLSVMATVKKSGHFSHMRDILVKIEDKNDNAPVFFPPLYESRVPENTKPNELVAALSAKDADSDDNGKVSYKILRGNENGHFSINASTGVIQTTSIALDYEDKKTFFLRIQASDGGKQPLTSEATVRVCVLDENDNPPIFQPNLDVQYSVTFGDNVPANTLLGQILATDLDSKKNGRVTFTILDGNTGGMLRLDAKSGELFNNAPLSDLDIFRLQIEAKDGGDVALTSTVIVNVFLQQLFSLAPNTPKFLHKVKEVQISESAKVGHQIALQTTTSDHSTSYFICKGNERQRFRVLEKKLQLIAAVDSPSYKLVVCAYDGSNIVNYTLNIKVKDVNNHYPEPQVIEKIANVPESAIAGTKVTEVSASDLDYGVNAQLKYFFKSAFRTESLGLFSIDEDSGKIFVKGELDYEHVKTHVLIVGIKDSSLIPLESTMYVVVDVDDVNEWKPAFLKSSYEVSIQDTIPRGSDVIKVIAQDKDQGLNGVLKYCITSGNVDYAFFIRPQSGVIQTNKVLSASDITKYKLTVEARDHGTFGLSSSVNITVHVQRSSLESNFRKTLYSASVYENEAVGTYVTTVNFNGWMVMYSFVNESECADSFLINVFTGVITTKKIIDAEKYSLCALTVKAEDGSGVIKKTRVVVKIEDRNDNFPVVSSHGYVGYIDENSPEDSVVLNTDTNGPLVISGHDADVHGSQLVYAIADSSMESYFKIDMHTGEIRTAKVSIDYETRHLYRLVIQVSDQGKPSLSVITTAVIHVGNINDNKPSFASSSLKANVYLPVYKDVRVTTLVATDRDNLTKLEFSITKQDIPGLLRVVRSTGKVLVDKPLQVRVGWYNADVLVSDGTYSTTGKLRVIFKSVTPTDLRFSRPIYQSHILENTSRIQTVLVPFIRGYSVGERLRFSLTNLDDVFTIQENTGAVKTRGNVVLDRESTDSYRLVVIVRDERNPPRVARCLVSVTVDDVNDCRPAFPPSPLFFVVSKRSEAGSKVATIAADDCDAGRNADVRYKIKKDDSKMFGIDQETGALSVLGQLTGLPSPSKFTLIIEARDLGKISLSSEAEVSMHIESSDACIFEKPFYRVELPENARVDVIFKQLHARCPKGKPIFSIVSGNNFTQFECDVNSGELSLLSHLDYEVVARYTLSVRAQDSKTGASSITTVDVLVKDINDNPPVLKSSSYYVKVEENSPPGTQLLRVLSTDKDSGENARHFFEIERDTCVTPGSFAIDQINGTVTVTRALDYETQKRCNIEVRVTDGGVPALHAMTSITVLIKDVNDNPPAFQRPRYHATVMENGGPSHFITQVVAKDPDESDFGKLTYGTVPGYGSTYFTIDPRSGVVTLSKVLGIQLGKVYMLNIIVDDGIHTAFTKLDVVVGQSNNHPPMFQKDVYEAYITENYPADSYVVMVTATDEDSGKFGEVTYAIDSPGLIKDFNIDSTTGIISTLKPFDRELESSVIIPVRASDAGGETTICTVKVNINDENDNQPRFLMPSYTAVISSKNTSVGENLIKVNAVDPDEGDNGALSYALFGQRSPHVFVINETTGVISFKRKPLESVYDFYVRAQDNGYVPLKSYAPVRVYIQTIQFKFQHSRYSFILPESFLGPVPFSFSLCDEKGKPVNSNVQFSMLTGRSDDTNGNATFDVDSKGNLVVARPLDFEKVQKYDLTVRANRSKITAFAIAQIHIQDVNDNRPEFESDIYKVSVPEDAIIGRNLVQVRAHDKDSGVNAIISYHLLSKSTASSNVFAVESRTGWLFVNGSLDREKVASYVIKIIAQDHGRNISLNSTATVRVNVDDVNDSPPVFSHMLYQVSVREDLPVYSTVLILNTTDSDISPEIAYYIVSGNVQNVFGVHQSSGKLFLASKLDRETYQSYRLNITAFDGVYTASAFVDVEVTDVNDNRPVCEQSFLRINVFEDEQVGSKLVTINASDVDDDSNNGIMFWGHSYFDVFTIEKNNGTVILKKALDREQQSTYNLLVSASDGENSCYTNLTIDILDVNDSPPKFTKSRFLASIPVDARQKSFVLRVEAKDGDIGENRKIEYDFVNSSTAELFTMERETGVISLKTRVLKRDEEKFVFDVIARDGGSPTLSSIASVEISVSTITNCPFLKDVYKKDISEHVKTPFVVDTVAVTCGDGEFSVIYKIAGESGKKYFEVDMHTGLLRLVKDLDYEMARAHLFTIEAFMMKPSGKTILINSVAVDIKVLDYNDNKPVFDRPFYVGFVNEGSKNGTFVIQLTAKDNDSFSVLRFSIIKSSPDSHSFVLDSLNGIVYVQNQLDYEIVRKYELIVRVEDNGVPSLHSDVRLTVNVNDLNDNPPVVEKELKLLFRMDSPVGQRVLQLRPTDADGPSNSEPFTFSIVSGDNDAYWLNSSSGELLVRKPLTCQNVTYNMTLQTVDNGSPALSALTHVEITVVKMTTEPPDVLPVTVYVNRLAIDVPEGVVGQIVLRNKDRRIVRFTLLKNDGLFSMGSKDGHIKMAPAVKAGIYSMKVFVFDGTFNITVPLTILVKEITSDVISNSVTIRITGMTLDVFVSKSLSSLMNALASITSSSLEEIYLWSIQTVSRNKLDVVFAVKKHGRMEFFSPENLYETLESKLEMFQKLSNIAVSSVGLFPCDCPAGKECQNVLSLVDEWSSLNEDSVIFISYRSQQNRKCVCQKGISEAECSHVPSSECLNNPCKPGFQCIDRPTGYQCVCPRGKHCQYGCLGNSCHTHAVSFNGYSYIRYNFRDETTKISSFSVSLRTTKSFGTIFSAKGARDFFHLEIFQGKIRARFDYGSGEGICLIRDVKVNDGKWHEIEMKRKERTVRLILDSGRVQAEAVATGSMSFLNVHMDNIIVGGKLPRRSVRSFTGNSDGFSGCMESPRLNGNALPLTGSNADVSTSTKGISHNCSVDVCNSFLCRNEGVCKVLDDKAVCNCKSGFTSNDCADDIDECLSSPCMNNGKCVNTLGSFHCTCNDSDFAGELCETRVSAVTHPKSLGTKEFVYIGATVSLLLIMVVIIALSCRCYNKRQKKTMAAKLKCKNEKLIVHATEEDTMLPPPPPPRRGDVDEPTPLLVSRAPSWDYADLSEMGPICLKIMSRSDPYCDHSGEYTGVPKVPQRPRHTSESDGVPDIPKKPGQYRYSRGSSQNSFPSHEDVSEFRAKDLEMIRLGRKDIEKLISSTTSFMEDTLDTKRASRAYDVRENGRSPTADTHEPFHTGHLETYDDKKVGYFIPDVDMRDSVSSSSGNHDERTATLEKERNPTNSDAKMLCQESTI